MTTEEDTLFGLGAAVILFFLFWKYGPHGAASGSGGGGSGGSGTLVEGSSGGGSGTGPGGPGSGPDPGTIQWTYCNSPDADPTMCAITGGGGATQ